MMRTAILLGERDERLGKASVSESTQIILHDGTYFIRTQKTMRTGLGGKGGIAVVFEPTELFIRDRLEPL